MALQEVYFWLVAVGAHSGRMQRKQTEPSVRFVLICSDLIPAPVSSPVDKKHVGLEELGPICSRHRPQFTTEEAQINYSHCIGFNVLL